MRFPIIHPKTSGPNQSFSFSQLLHYQTHRSPYMESADGVNISLDTVHPPPPIHSFSASVDNLVIKTGSINMCLSGSLGFLINLSNNPTAC